MRTLHDVLAPPVLLLATLALAAPASAQDGTVENEQKISDMAGGFNGILDNNDHFGTSVARAGDLDGDTIGDAIVGAAGDDDGSLDSGAAWVLFLSASGTVRDKQKISMTAGGFRGTLATGDNFGSAVAYLGTPSVGGNPRVAVGARNDNGIGLNRGSVWILTLNPDGTVTSEREIGDRTGNLGGVLANGDRFGSSVTSLGDFNGDGFTDIAVGAPGDDEGGTDRGAIWILILDPGGLVSSKVKISSIRNNFTGPLADEDAFGTSIANIGDLDGDGVVDLAVGAAGDNDGGPDRGAVWIVLLRPDGTVKADHKISDLAGGFTGALDNNDLFGSAVDGVGDQNGDTVPDLVVGAPGDGDGGALHGAIWVLFMNANGTVGDHQNISETDGGFGGTSNGPARFGSAVGFLGDQDGDGVGDIACGAPQDNDGGVSRGAVWALFLGGLPYASATTRNGSGINPVILVSITLPVFGTTWIADLDCAGHGASVCAVMGGDTPTQGFVLGPGEILLDFVTGSQYFFTITPHTGNVVRFQYPIPLDTSYAGTPVYTQGLVLGSPGAKLTNGIDLILGV